MKKSIAVFLALAGLAITPKVNAQSKMVGGAAMPANKNIVQNISNSKDHTTLVNALKAAGLGPTLSSAGPFTLFAPTNEAFAKLPAGTVDNLVKPANKAALIKLLTYQVVAGKITTADLFAKIKDGKGKAELGTLSGGTLTVATQGARLCLIDEKGNKSFITIADINQGNGIIHVINAVLMPN